jgi:hypothetical protein
MGKDGSLREHFPKSADLSEYYKARLWACSPADVAAAQPTPRHVRI